MRKKQADTTDIRLIQMANYVRPTLEENLSKNWVLNGRNNIFYQNIIDRYNGSPTNAAIINSYVDLMYGNGLDAKNKNLLTWSKFKTILKDSELRKIISDFELFGEASMQVIKAKNGKDLAAIYHIPKQYIVPTLENEEGEIEGYWYSKDFSNTHKYPPEYYSAFGTSKDAIEIYCVKPYKAGKNYFSDPDYLAAMPYCQMEEELANFYINSIRKGLSAGYIINIPDGGTRTPEEKDEIERKIKEKLTGSPNAMNFVISFNGIDREINIVPFPVNDAQHKQWEYLTGESRQQIMTGHRVVSPKLFGIMSDGGLGNNANELDEAEAQLMKRVIQPKQRYILEALEDILVFYNINLDLYFRPLTENTTTTQLSSEKKNTDLDDFINLGEDVDLEGWDLVDEEKYTDDSVELNLASVPSNLPLAPSEIDNDYFKVRFEYAGSLNPQREFCQKMIGAGKVFRLEDINAASKKPVNAGWGPNGATTYDILKYKGGGDCHHYWIRKVYLKKGNSYITVANAKKLIRDLKKQGIKTEIPTSGEELSTKAPKDMPYNGFLPTNKRFQ
jgi:hypothetical protein